MADMNSGRTIFQTVTPESVGISSRKVLHFLQTLEKYKLNLHSILMARGDQIFTEVYFAPFSADTKHRMYSVSKSFTAIAVGLAQQQGLLTLEDRVVDYFPEYLVGNEDPLIREATIRDLLTMRSSFADKAPDYWGKPDRVKAYFDMTSNQIPGTNFSYDSTGAFILGCIVEKVTGQPFLEYLKEQVLLELGFSRDAYCLLAPGGHSHSDSGVMCTSRDLLTFARLVMNGGTWNGKRYLDEQFMREAVATQTDNNVAGAVSAYGNYGYGYLIWKAPRDGFAFVGMANQLAICDPKTDLIFVITAEEMAAEQQTRMLIYHELYETVVAALAEPLPEDDEAYRILCDYCSGRQILSLTGGVQSDLDEAVSGKVYVMEPNPMGIDALSVRFHGQIGELMYRNAEGENRIKFGMAHNEFGTFPGKKRIGLTASQYEDGVYECAASAIWCEYAKLHITVRVIDTYMGSLNVVLSFKDDRVAVVMKRAAQRILDGLNGCAIGSCISD